MELDPRWRPALCGALAAMADLGAACHAVLLDCVGADIDGVVWAGDAAGCSTPCTLTLDDDKAVVVEVIKL